MKAWQPDPPTGLLAESALSFFLPVGAFTSPMFDSLKARFILIFALAALSAWTLVQRGILLGLDLRGGTHLAIEIADPTERTFPPLGDTREGSSYIDAKWQTADAMRDYHRRFYHPGNAVLVV